MYEQQLEVIVYYAIQLEEDISKINELDDDSL